MPRDVAIIGFDDIEMAGWPGYRLTTVQQPMTETVRATVDLLRRRLAGEDMPPQALRIPTRLIIRASTLPVDVG
ncbi:substrate-binding domain-containing protein [Elstera litoralis]|uniref:substrate-binding domain-containing protein n=1 Tax=Elstera litoralis TaxID=552518 RepID=UPI00069700BA|nr:substrate-binding domain-containing protein [Elstera litoralis]